MNIQIYLCVNFLHFVFDQLINILTGYARSSFKYNAWNLKVSRSFLWSVVLMSIEIPASETPHDITHMVQNLISELPSQFKNKQTQTEFGKFSESTVGDKNQLESFRRAIIWYKLAKFVSIQYSENIRFQKL
jgi:hypothetical protein